MPVDTVSGTLIAAFIAAGVALIVLGVRGYLSHTPQDVVEDWRTLVASRLSELEERILKQPALQRGSDPPTPEERRSVKKIVDGLSEKARAYNDAYDLLQNLERAKRAFFSSLIQTGIVTIGAPLFSFVAMAENVDSLVPYIIIIALVIVAGFRENFASGKRIGDITGKIREGATQSMGLERMEL